MELALLAIIAGVLTVLSPCILPLLPVVLSGFGSKKSARAPLIIIGSALLSIIAFSLLLKGTSLFISVPSSFWLRVSGSIVAIVGVSYAFPVLWAKFFAFIGLESKTQQLSASAAGAQTETNKNVILGLSLGPVFTSCSPTYGIIVATILPASFLLGVVYILLYAVGLGAALAAIAIGGQRFVGKFNWALSPTFRRVTGGILIAVGLLLITGWIKDIETWLVLRGIDFTQFEWRFLEL